MFSLDVHPDSRRLADLLAAVPRGEVITLSVLSAGVGRDVRQCRHLLYRGMRIAERESGAVFATVIGKGYRRLSPEEIVHIGQTARARIRQAARRGARSIAAGVQGANDIAPDVHRRILAEQSALGLLEHIARDKSLPEINEAEQRPLSIADSAKGFLKAIGSVAA